MHILQYVLQVIPYGNSLAIVRMDLFVHTGAPICWIIQPSIILRLWKDFALQRIR